MEYEYNEVNKLLSKLRYMYYQTELDGDKINFKEFIEGLKHGESFQGLINTQKKINTENSQKASKKRDSFILIKDGEVKLALYVNKNILDGEQALKEISNPDKIKYSRLNKEKINEILKKAKEADLVVNE